LLPRFFQFKKSSQPPASLGVSEKASQSPATDGNGSFTFASPPTVEKLSRLLLSKTSLSYAEVREIASDICIDGRAGNLRCEEMIVEVKKLASRVADVSTALSGLEKRAVLDRLITLLIDEFYRKESGDVSMKTYGEPPLPSAGV
jgi:hypothetical protein